MTSAPALVFAVTEDWYFWSHRRRLAQRLMRLGCGVSVMTRFKQHRRGLEDNGFQCIAMPFERSLRRPWRDLRAMLRLARFARGHGPDVVHLVSLKPILLSLLGVYTARRVQWVAAITGMGYLFSSNDRAAVRYRGIVLRLLRLILRAPNVGVIVQNEDDLALLADHGLGCDARTVLIAGVGVDLEEFPLTPQPEGAPLVVLPARLIRDKGVAEFVAAAALVKERHPAARFALVGADDPDNPAAIPMAERQALLAAGNVEWWGYRSDMAAVYREASLVCLPSYREGLPKVLLEAAASGRPLVATDVPGCRDVCRHGVNGLLVPARDPAALAQAIASLLGDPARRAAFAAAGRRIVETEYEVGAIARQTLEFYQRLLSAPRAGG